MKAVVAGAIAGMFFFAFDGRGLAANSATFKEKVIYSFCSRKKCEDGTLPTGLIAANGLLYGTAYNSGRDGCIPDGCGTAFSLDPGTGALTVLYLFCSRSECKDGEGPNGGIIYANGTLYGTTQTGGSGVEGEQFGTAFSLDPDTHREKVIYAFCRQQNCPDGQNPSAGLIDVNGTLYGTTQTGGNGHDDENGTAFSLDPVTGTETVLYDFCSQEDCIDGEQPTASLIDVKNMLYGTTLSGGAYGCGNGQACGTVFSLDPATGTETVLHSFGAGTDGAYPRGVIMADGLLYGTTNSGGVNDRHGTVYSVDPGTGAEKVLYAFCSLQNCSDGADPFSTLIDVKGLLYGTTSTGGGTGCGGEGCGTVFSIDPQTGVENVIYAFQGGTDGADPDTGLIEVKGTLYGTTEVGGAQGLGTVYALEKNR